MKKKEKPADANPADLVLRELMSRSQQRGLIFPHFFLNQWNF